MINTIFYIIDTIILIAFFWYFFKKYVLPAIRESIAHEQRQKHELVQQRTELYEKQRALAFGRQDQRKLYQQLLEKVVRWQVLCKEEVEHQDSQKELLKQVIYDRRKKQLDRYQQMRAMREIKPYVLQQVHERLYDYFQEDPAHGKAYIKHILDTVAQRKA